MDDYEDRKFWTAVWGGASGSLAVLAVVFVACQLATFVWLIVLAISLALWLAAGGYFLRLELLESRVLGRRPRSVRALIEYVIYFV